MCQMCQLSCDQVWYVDLATVPSQRAGAGLTRYEVIDQRGRLLGKGATKSTALAAAWRKFQRDVDRG